MDFTSDNIAGVSTQILAALGQINEVETVLPYGQDPMSQSLNSVFSKMFQRPAFVYPVISGTAANALSLATCVQGWQAVLAHEKAHIHTMECGAPEFFTGGAKVLPVGGKNGKISPQYLQAEIQNSGQGCLHRSQIKCLSLTQTTDAGTVYTPTELAELVSIAQQHDLFVHMDGARFANAVSALRCDPADLIQGVDVLTFGATKNGAMNAEALVFFNEDLARNFEFQAKRAGHITSKMRYLSAQLLAYLDNDLWLNNAAYANEQAQFLAQKLAETLGVKTDYPVESNIVFATLPNSFVAHLKAGGVGFYARPQGKDHQQVRFVTSFSTRTEAISVLLDVFRSFNLAQQAA